MKVDVLGDDISNLELIDSMPECCDCSIFYENNKYITYAEQRILDAARVSFDKGFDKAIEGMQSEAQWQKDVNLLNYLVRNLHTSPFEHILLTFEVTCPLPISKQWMRHRTWKFNEVSRRYTNKNIEFYIPTIWAKQSSKNKQAGEGLLDENIQDELSASLLELVGISSEMYEKAISLGVSNEQARLFLPQNLYTSFVGTIDLHNLMKFVLLRNSEHAQFEIRLYAQHLDNFIKLLIPNCYDSYKHFWSLKDE